MSSSLNSGSILAVPGTLRGSGTINVAGNYQCLFDLGAMRDGDEVQIRITNNISPRGTPTLLFDASYNDQQTVSIKTTEVFYVFHLFATFQIGMTAGAARWFNYETISVY